jgi:DNA-binding CsgD family transcriptional regulator
MTRTRETRVADGKPLTEHQVIVLRCLARGMSAEEIGKTTYVSTETVRTHLRRLYRRLGVVNAAQAVAVGYQQGVLTGAQPVGQRVPVDQFVTVVGRHLVEISRDPHVQQVQSAIGRGQVMAERLGSRLAAEFDVRERVQP